MRRPIKETLANGVDPNQPTQLHRLIGALNIGFKYLIFQRAGERNPFAMNEFMIKHIGTKFLLKVYVSA